MTTPRWILISGASGLLGSSISADLLAHSDYYLLLADIYTAQLKNTYSTEISSGRVSCFEVDMSTESGITRCFDFIQEEGIVLSGALNAAYPRSAGWGAPIHNLEEENLFYDLSAQLGGSILFSKHVINHFLAHTGGTLIHLSSIQGVSAPKFQHYAGTDMHSPIEYSAIKAGLIASVKWLAKYYANSNIRVNAVSPGGIISNQPASFVSRYREDCTNIGMLEPSMIANVVTFLFSQAAHAINGQNMFVDEGWPL